MFPSVILGGLPVGNARRDWEIVCDLRRSSRTWTVFPYTSTEEMLEELRRAPPGGSADYA